MPDRVLVSFLHQAFRYRQKIQERLLGLLVSDPGCCDEDFREFIDAMERAGLLDEQTAKIEEFRFKNRTSMHAEDDIFDWDRYLKPSSEFLERLDSIFGPPTHGPRHRPLPPIADR